MLRYYRRLQWQQLDWRFSRLRYREYYWSNSVRLWKNNDIFIIITNCWQSFLKAAMIDHTTQWKKLPKTFFRLEPICCSSTNVKIDEMSCIRDRINIALSKFDHSIAQDLVYRGIQCWHQYNENNVLFDLIWKAEICSFHSQYATAKRLGKKFNSHIQ